MKKYCIDNECMLDFIEMYVEGKARLWKILFGWRRSHVRKKKWAYSIYMIPEKIYQMAVDMAKKYDDYEIL